MRFDGIAAGVADDIPEVVLTLRSWLTCFARPEFLNPAQASTTQFAHSIQDQQNQI
jgi:hypothetical protein